MRHFIQQPFRFLFAQNGFPLLLAFFTTLLLIDHQSTVADTFIMKTGGEFQGELVNPKQNPRKTYVIRTEANNLVQLKANLVKHVVTLSPSKVAYQQIKTKTPDTAEGHWQLYKWCVKNKLLNEPKRHLRRILELQPDHEEARRILDYIQIDGQWLSRGEKMDSRGYVNYEGTWRTAQDVAIREQKAKTKKAQDAWKKDVRRWIGWLKGRKESRVIEAKQNILNTKDPHAARALVDALKKGRNNYQLKLLLLEALSHIKHGLATEAIGNHALLGTNSQQDVEIRIRCIEYLMEKNNRALVRPYVKLLSSKDNTQVNRAASVLGSLGFESAISPLIDALVTKHTYKNPNAGKTQASAGPGGTSFGQGGPTTFSREKRNADVLTALQTLTDGVHYDYNETAWRAWYTNSKRENFVNMRRDN